MNRLFKSLIFCLSIAMMAGTELVAAPKGKLDMGPAFVHIDILESGHTVKRMDMWAGRADFSYELCQGLYVKPSILYSHGDAAKGGLFSASAGLAYYVPCYEWLAVAPTAGIGYCHLWTKIDLPQYMLTDLQERFKSLSPYVGIDLYITLCEGWRLVGSYQYSWSRTHTTIEKVAKSKSHSQGPVYAAMVECDLSSQWSVNLGVAYNISLSKEKHGLRGSGIKAGVAYWF